MLSPQAILPGKKSPNKYLSDTIGFSIVEVIFVIALLGMTIFVIVSLFSYGLRKEKAAEKTTIATNLAQARIETIISQSYDEASIGTTTENTLTSLDPDFSSFSRITAIHYLDSNLQIAAQDYDLKRIKVIVGWYDPQKNGTSAVTLFSLINKQ